MAETTKGVKTDGMFTETQQKLIDKINAKTGDSGEVTEEIFLECMQEVDAENPLTDYTERLEEYRDVADSIGLYNIGAKMDEQAKGIASVSEKIAGKSMDEIISILANEKDLQKEFTQKDKEDIFKISLGENGFSEEKVNEIVEEIHKQVNPGLQYQPVEEDLDSEPIVVEETLDVNTDSQEKKHPIKVEEEVVNKLVYMKEFEKNDLYANLKKQFKETKFHSKINRIFRLTGLGEQSLKNYLKDRTNSISEYESLIKQLKSMENPTSKTDKMLEKAQKKLETEKKLKAKIEMVLKDKEALEKRAELKKEADQSMLRKPGKLLKIGASRVSSLKKYYDSKKGTKTIEALTDQAKEYMITILNSLEGRSLETLQTEINTAKNIEDLILKIEAIEPEAATELKEAYGKVSSELINKKLWYDNDKKLQAVDISIEGIVGSVEVLKSQQSYLRKLMDEIVTSNFSENTTIYTKDYVVAELNAKNEQINQKIEAMISSLDKKVEEEQPEKEQEKKTEEEQSTIQEEKKEEPIKEETEKKQLEEPDKEDGDKELSNPKSNPNLGGKHNNPEMQEIIEKFQDSLAHQQKSVAKAADKIQELEEVNKSLINQLAEERAKRSTQNMEDIFQVDTTKLNRQHQHDMDGLDKKLGHIDSELNRYQGVLAHYLDGSQFEKEIENNKDYTVFLEGLELAERKAMIAEWSSQYARTKNQQAITQMQSMIQKLEHEKTQVELEKRNKEIEKKKIIAAEKEAKLREYQAKLEAEKQEIYQEETKMRLEKKQADLMNDFDLDKLIQVATETIDNQPLALPNDLESSTRTR